MTDMNPYDVEQSIRRVASRITEGVGHQDKAYRAYLDADREFDKAFAKAYLNHDGPAHERRYVADLDTMDEREARDIADAANRYAEKLGRALVEELRSLQSVGASLRAAYIVAGRGEGA